MCVRTLQHQIWFYSDVMQVNASHICTISKYVAMDSTLRCKITRAHVLHTSHLRFALLSCDLPSITHNLPSSHLHNHYLHLPLV